jgi:hypothetical protein
MENIPESTTTDRRLLYFVAGLLIIILVFGAYFFTQQKKENRALSLKILMMSEKKRTPKPWTQILTPPKLLTDTAKAVSASTASVTTEEIKDSAELPLSEQDTQTLALKLDTQMRNVQNLELNAIDNNILIADEIISREPNSDMAYKAKLISMLIKEGKFKKPIDEGEVNAALESMAQLTSDGGQLAEHLAAYDSTANASLANSEERMNQISEEKAIFEARLKDLEPDSPERDSLVASISKLQSEEDNTLRSMDDMNDLHDESVGQLMSEEVLDIPLRRMLANGNYEEVADNAQSLIDQYPKSTDGYFFLYKALELQGQKEEALNMIRNAQLNPNIRDDLIQKLEMERSQDPKLYWQHLKF